MTPLEYLQQNPDATDEQILAALNTPVYSPVPLSRIEVWTVAGSRRARLRAAAANEQLPAELRAGVQDLLDALASPRLENLDLTDEVIRDRWQMGAGGLAQVGVLSSDEAAELQAMGVTLTSCQQDDVDAARLGLAKMAKRQQLADAYNLKVAAVDAATSPAELETL